MSIPKEKLIIQEIKEWMVKLQTKKISLETFYYAVASEVNNYVDPGYIGEETIKTLKTGEQYEVPYYEPDGTVKTCKFNMASKDQKGFKRETLIELLNRHELEVGEEVKEEEG